MAAAVLVIRTGRSAEPGTEEHGRYGPSLLGRGLENVHMSVAYTGTPSRRCSNLMDVAGEIGAP